MLKSHLDWFFRIWDKHFHQTRVQAFETVMFLAVAHFFGFYNPKQCADYLGIPHQNFYRHLKELSLYTVRKLLVKFMVKQAVDLLKPILSKSASTISRAGITLSVDNSVIDRLGKMLRWTWSWYSGRWKKVMNGQDLLGIVITVNGLTLPIMLVFCSKQGRRNTDKPSLLLSMLKDLITEFKKEGIDLTVFPISMDSWFVSEDLKQKLYALGFKTVIVAGKSNYVFTIGRQKKKVSEWKKVIVLQTGQWGIDVPFKRVRAVSPTFGPVVLCFYKKSTTKNYYLLDFSQEAKRGVEVWHIWKEHYLIECFWKILKSVFAIKSMRPQGDGPYAALLIKVVAYLIAIRFKTTKRFSKMSITQIMRKINRDFKLEEILHAHFHLQFSAT